MTSSLITVREICALNLSFTVRPHCPRTGSTGCPRTVSATLHAKSALKEAIYALVQLARPLLCYGSKDR